MRSGGDRSGFTLIESMTAVLIASALARIAVPNVQEMTLRARAAEVVGEIRAVEVAALNYSSATNRWPDDRASGEVPPELRPFLPADFAFDRDDHALDWERWILPDGLPSRPGTTVLVGVSVTAEDENLVDAVAQLVGPTRARFVLEERYTFILAD